MANPAIFLALRLRISSAICGWTYQRILKNAAFGFLLAEEAVLTLCVSFRMRVSRIGKSRKGIAQNFTRSPN
jgi:hypothetical protein